MAAGTGVSWLEPWRGVVTAGLRYYGRMGSLAVDFVGALIPVLYLLPNPVRTATSSPSRTQALAGNGGATILIEAEAGKRGVGVFQVENRGAAAVSSPISVSAFADDSGHQVRPAISFQPKVLVLEPGQQTLVQIMATIDEGLAPNVRYSARVSLPGLSETGVPVVLRRRPSQLVPAEVAVPPRRGPAPARRRPRARPATRDRRGS